MKIHRIFPIKYNRFMRDLASILLDLATKYEVFRDTTFAFFAFFAIIRMYWRVFMKQIAVLPLILLIFCFSLSVFAMKSADGLWECEVNDEMEAVIVAYHGKEAELEIPAFIDGYKVIALGDEVFASNANLTSVIIPEYVMSIGYGTFAECPKLSSITLPEGLMAIGDYAFYSCKELASIEIPPFVTEIGDNAFCFCYGLREAILPEGLISIGGRAFDYCSSLTQIILPQSLEYLGGCAFEGCNLLETVVLPESLECHAPCYLYHFPC